MKTHLKTKALIFMALTIIINSVNAYFHEDLMNVEPKLVNATEMACNAYGLMGVTATSLVNSVVPGLKDSAQQTCCKFPKFKSNHPNVTKNVLGGCPNIEADRLVGKEQACNFAALAGGQLSNLPATAKTTLSEKCCESIDPKIHPKARIALACN
ncbi:MAG: hypothetical protein K2X90_00460 [Candidatus Babeliaceae bacterium]|nr:hypothetical protein [Candidatus Babeliaceae bacterium]